MANYDDFLNAVDDGIAGKSIWIPIGLERLGEHIGITKRIYTVLAGFAGTGKTSIADVLYVLNPYEWIKSQPESYDTKLRWIYFSMERNSVYKLAKWTSYKLFKDHGILIDVKTILKWNSGERSAVDTKLRKLLTSYRDYFQELLEHVYIIDGPKRPSEIKEVVELIMAQQGKIVKSDTKSIYINGIHEGDFDVDTYEKTSTGQLRFYKDIRIYNRTIRVYPNEEKYEPKDPKLVMNIIQDHVGCAIGENMSKKQIIDTLSANNRHLRDFYGCHIVAVSQMNRSLADSTRRTKLEVLPELSDIKNTSNLSEDCDVVLGLINPYKFKINDYLGYSIPSFVNRKGYNRFRSITLIKNTYGADDVSVGLHFIGEIGGVTELPKPETMSKALYAQAANLSGLVSVNYIDGEHL